VRDDLLQFPIQAGPLAGDVERMARIDQGGIERQGMLILGDRLLSAARACASAALSWVAALIAESCALALAISASLGLICRASSSAACAACSLCWPMAA
jgi:hypothetical protein